MVLVLAIGWFVLNKTYFGRYIYAIGGNDDVARLSGIRVNRIRRLVYMPVSYTHLDVYKRQV